MLPIIPYFPPGEVHHLEMPAWIRFFISGQRTFHSTSFKSSSRDGLSRPNLIRLKHYQKNVRLRLHPGRLCIYCEQVAVLKITFCEMAQAAHGRFAGDACPAAERDGVVTGAT